MRYTYPFLLFFVFLVFNACTQTSDQPESETPQPPKMEEPEMLGDEDPDPPQDTISLDSANVWSCNFQNFMKGGVTAAQWNSIKAKGFFIPEADVTQLTSLSNVNNLRAYLGLRNDTLKLMFVGVDASGNDILTLITDFTSPCPPDCGTNKQITSCAD